MNVFAPSAVTGRTRRPTPIRTEGTIAQEVFGRLRIPSPPIRVHMHVIFENAKKKARDKRGPSFE
jgi:hypothetical protein